MEYAIIAVPAAPVRKKAKHQSEMSNQLLFGESVKIIKEKGPLWIKVKSLHDQYEGWITRNQAAVVDQVTGSMRNYMVTNAIFNTITIHGHSMKLPMGANLPFFENGTGSIGKWKFQYDGSYVSTVNVNSSPATLEALCLEWINVPYMWGGRTMMGVDCSGFVQMNFKMIGIDLPRDAWQQAQLGVTISKLQDAQTGDLAFFNDKDEIVHVGILLGPTRIIHASGRVRIDIIDKKGIINGDTGKRSHQLQIIRRPW